jgi:YihY family inner membrane protein
MYFLLAIIYVVVYIPLMTVFFSLNLVYKFAPRRPTRFAEVWIGALCATVLLRVAEHLFLIYLKNVGTVNAVYGTFGGIMALLLWIYLSGCIFIFGACLCAAQGEETFFHEKAKPKDICGNIVRQFSFSRKQF